MTTLLVGRLLQGAAGAFGMVTGNAVVRGPGERTRGRPAVQPADAGQRCRADPRAGAGCPAAAGDRVAGAVRDAGGRRDGPPSRRRGGRCRRPHPVAARRPAAPRSVAASFGVLLRDRALVGLTMGRALGAAALLAYVSASPFVFQVVYGLSPQQFSAVFAVNSAGLIGMGQLSGRLVRRVGPERLLRGRGRSSACPAPRGWCSRCWRSCPSCWCCRVSSGWSPGWGWCSRTRPRSG